MRKLLTFRTGETFADLGLRLGDGQPQDRRLPAARLLRPPALALGTPDQRAHQPLLREYLPKGIEITSDVDYLASVAAEINDRPRKILNWKKPSEVFAEILASDASTP